MAREEVLVELTTLYKNLQEQTLKYIDKISGGPDPEMDPVESMSEYFAPIQNKLNNILEDLAEGDEIYVKIVAMKASVLYEKAKIFMNLNLNHESFVNLDEAKELVTPLKSNSFIVYLYLRIMNHVSYIFSKIGEYSNARTILEEVLEIKFEDDVVIYNTEELFAGKQPDKSMKDSKVHRLKINNIQMLSWVYSKMGLTNESSLEQHLILAEELKFAEIDPIEWATKCARVAILHLTQENWVTSRYYLSVAYTTMNRLEREMMEHPMLNKAFAELARGWIYYGLRLFDSSRSKEMERACNKLFDDNTEEDPSVYKELPPNEALNFANYEVEIERVPAILVHNPETARALFNYTQTWMKRARMFYTLRDHPFIHVNCILDLSELYRYLAYFDTDIESQYVYQQRRSAALDTLCSVLKEVRPQCYAAVSVELFRELAEVQIEMLGLNLKRISRIEAGSDESQDTIQRRIDATMNIQDKLEKFGDTLGHGNLSEQDDETKSVPGINEDLKVEEDAKGAEHPIDSDGAGDTGIGDQAESVPDKKSTIVVEE